MDVPETRYTRAPDGAFIAFQVFGSGAIDVLLMPGFFTNLDENALRTTPVAGTVRNLAAPGRLEVEDHGPGIAQDDLTPAFHRFYIYDKSPRCRRACR